MRQVDRDAWWAPARAALVNGGLVIVLMSVGFNAWPWFVVGLLFMALAILPSPRPPGPRQPPPPQNG